MTMTALCISDKQVVYAGLHQSLLIFRAATQTVQELESQGIWLGMLDEIEGLNADRCVEFAPGDGLLLFTDGLIETRRAADQTFIDIAPVMERYAAESCQARSCEEIAQSIMALTAAGIVRDDISVVALRRLGAQRR